jgi:sortase (surface protein transpeptidase)
VIFKPRGRSNGQRRRWSAAALVLGLGLLTAAGALALRTPDAGKLRTPDASKQLERVLPAPASESAVEEVSGDHRAEAPSSYGPRAKRTTRVQMPDPARIVISAIGVSAPVISLGLNPDRTLEVPEDYSKTGWFSGGPEPGERGAAVIVGHVDSKTGPAVFYRLRALEPGDVIKIVLEDESTLRFVADSMMAVPKDDFPTKLVYARTQTPTLRLITCDGEFDESTGHYTDNYIVFARIAERA